MKNLKTKKRVDRGQALQHKMTQEYQAYQPITSLLNSRFLERFSVGTLEIDGKAYSTYFENPSSWSSKLSFLQMQSCARASMCSAAPADPRRPVQTMTAPRPNFNGRLCAAASQPHRWCFQHRWHHNSGSRTLYQGAQVR